MGVSNERFRLGNVFIDHNFEEVLFRYESSTRRFYRRFYGESKEDEVQFDNRLLHDAILFGEETDEDTYMRGKPKT